MDLKIQESANGVQQRPRLDVEVSTSPKRGFSLFAKQFAVKDSEQTHARAQTHTHTHARKRLVTAKKKTTNMILALIFKNPNENNCMLSTFQRNPSQRVNSRTSEAMELLSGRPLHSNADTRTPTPWQRRRHKLLNRTQLSRPKQSST